MKKLYALITIGAAAGLASSFWQLMEKIAILKNKDVILSCNFNDVFSCSNVLNAHQSSVFGPPNSVIGIIMFSFFLTIGIVGLSGAKLADKLALTVQGLALFMLGFVLWFLYQSTYNIRSICIFCLFIGTGTLLINGALLRRNLEIIPLGSMPKKQLKKLGASGGDIFAWSLLWLIVALAMWLQFK